MCVTSACPVVVFGRSSGISHQGHHLLGAWEVPLSQSHGEPMGAGLEPLLCPKHADVTHLHWTPKTSKRNLISCSFPLSQATSFFRLLYKEWCLQGTAKPPVLRGPLGAPAVGAGLGM